MNRRLPLLLTTGLAPGAGDGYVRLPADEIDTLRLHHLYTVRDPTLEHRLGGLALCAGATEWLATMRSRCDSISLGWDWRRHPLTRCIALLGQDIRSNLMLTDTKGRDLGYLPTAEILRQFIQRQDWIGTVDATHPATAHGH